MAGRPRPEPHHFLSYSGVAPAFLFAVSRSHETVRTRMDNALALIEKGFQETTIADILAEPTTSQPLCPFPRLIEKPSGRKAAQQE